MEQMRKLCQAVYVEVQCERNEPDDIACGGPIMLGYSFYISKDESLSEYKNHIKECLTKYNRPFINMIVTLKDKVNPRYILSKEDIEDMIKHESI